jgi:hypothetical protein
MNRFVDRAMRSDAAGQDDMPTEQRQHSGLPDGEESKVEYTLPTRQTIRLVREYEGATMDVILSWSGVQSRAAMLRTQGGEAP